MKKLIKNKEELTKIIFKNLEKLSEEEYKIFCETFNDNYDYFHIDDMSSLFTYKKRINQTIIENIFYTSNIIPNLDTSNVINMDKMFYNCRKLKTIPLLNTSNIINMYAMFSNCINLEDLPLLDTSNVINMKRMFENCIKLKTVPLLDTSGVENMRKMFENCKELKKIPQLNTKKVKDMSYMFKNCQNLRKKPNFNITNLNNNAQMYSNCKFLQLLIEHKENKKINKIKQNKFKINLKIYKEIQQKGYDKDLSF